MKKVVNLKVILTSLIFILLLSFSIVLVGCGDESSGKINFIVDGQTYESVETDGFERIVLPAEPVKDGYDFAGWYYDDQTFEYTFSSTDFIKQQLTVELSLYAKFEESVYRTINYNLDGGTNSPNNVTTLSSGKELLLSDPTAPSEYLRFAGWFTDSEFKNQITQVAKGRESQIDLYAKWLVKDGYGLYAVKSSSMEPALTVGQSVITTSDYQELQVGDIVVISYSDSSNYYCRRIVEIDEVEGQTRYVTKGDNNLLIDSSYVTVENILGKVIGVIETPASDDDINMGGEITFTAPSQLSIEAYDVNASVSARVQNSAVEIAPYDEEFNVYGEEWKGFDLSSIAFNDNLDPIILTLNITNNSSERDMTVYLSSRIQEQHNVVLDIVQNDRAYVSGEELTLPSQESMTFTITFTTRVTSGELDIKNNITFGLVLEDGNL